MSFDYQKDERDRKIINDILQKDYTKGTKMKEIYIIMWRGRDSESGIWDDYPCFNCGFFTDKDKAEQFATELNKQEPAEFDDDAQETSGYYVALLRQNERDTKGE